MSTVSTAIRDAFASIAEAEFPELGKELRELHAQGFTTKQQAIELVMAQEDRAPVVSNALACLVESIWDA